MSDYGESMDVNETKDDSDQEIDEEDNEEIDEEAEEASDSDNVIEWELSVRLIEFIIIMGWRKWHVRTVNFVLFIF